MKAKLKYIGIVCSTLVCTYITFIVSVAISGICTGRNEGTMSVSSCRIGGSLMATIANNGYGFLLLGLFLIFIPIVLWLTGIIGGWFYRKRYREKCIRTTGMIILGANALMLCAAIVTHIVLSITS